MSAYVAIYGIICLVVAVVLITLEYYLGGISGIGSTIFPSSLVLGTVNLPYPVEVLSTVIILVIFFAEAAKLAFFRARSKYALYDDGLYVDTGIVNLENTFLSPLAFSDARLIRTWSMRIVNRGLIIVDANDGRHFHLRLVKDPIKVQALIRDTLSHPRVKIG